MIDTLQDVTDLVVLAEDEAGLYLQAEAMAVWAPQGQPPEVRLDPRPERISFYGSLDLQTGQETVTRADTCNSAATIAHLQAILEAYPVRPILLFWDRASWHRSHAVQHFLQRHGRIEIVEFPVGSPDLNPQEHVWKAVRRTMEHNHQHDRFGSLADAFEHELRTRHFPSAFFRKYGGAVVCPMLE